MLLARSWLIVAALCAGACTEDDPRNPPPSDSDLGADEDTGGDGDEDLGDGDDGPLACGGTATFIGAPGAQALHAFVEVPEHCLLFAVDPGSRFVFALDTATDGLRTTIDVGNAPRDLALSADRSLLYVAVTGDSRVVAVDVATLAVVESVATTVAPHRITRGPGRRVLFVGEADYQALLEVDFDTDTERELTTQQFHEPDLDAVADGSQVFVGESAVAPGRLFTYAVGEAVTAGATYTFDGGFVLPQPTRRVHVDAAAGRVFFAERQFSQADVRHVRAFYGDDVVAFTRDGRLLATGESIVDAVTSVAFALRPHPSDWAAFSEDGTWLYEFAPGESGVHRTRVTTLIGVHRVGDTNVPPGPLSQRAFSQLVADPVRPVLYGLDPQRNELVYIDRETELPTRAEYIGPTPTDLALLPDGDTMLVATFGGTELALLDLTSSEKALSRTVRVPSNPFRVAVGPNGRAVYVEQDQLTDLFLLDLDTSEVLTRLDATVFQPDIELDPTGRYLYAGESSGAGLVLRRYDLLSNTFLETHVSDSYDYPTRRVLFAAAHVFYAGRKLSASNLNEVHDFAEEVVAVTPDNRFVITPTRIIDNGPPYDTAAGLPASSGVVAVDPDSQRVYQFDNATGSLFAEPLPN